jgi:hypothetical protein
MKTKSFIRKNPLIKNTLATQNYKLTGLIVQYFQEFVCLQGLYNYETDCF